MKYIKYIKDAFFVIIIVYLSITITENVLMIKKLQNQIEQNKENLFQTNRVIEEMQKRLKNSLFSQAY
tara:strand:- start:2024 stop:2227 length:204 start_codon:yes stop_codon:yes gene_type:complete